MPYIQEAFRQLNVEYLRLRFVFERDRSTQLSFYFQHATDTRQGG